MIRFLIGIMGVAIFILFILAALLKARLDEIEEGLDKRIFDDGKYSYRVVMHSEPEELTQEEVKLLKKFTKDYLKFSINNLTIFETAVKDNRPLHRYTWKEFIEQDFNWLRDLVLYPDKLEQEQEKIKLKKEIEDKQKELSEMD